MNVNNDFKKLIEILPFFIQDYLNYHKHKTELLEIVLDLGRRPEARFTYGQEYLSQKILSWHDLDHITQRIGKFNNENRSGIERTLHRISCIRNRQFLVNGLTCRIGRAIVGTITLIRDLLESNKSILILGRPGVGKTTIIREMSRVLADEMGQRVIIIDTANEIAGDSDIPHLGIGQARRMQVSKTELQHQVMLEAVENHMPQIIIIDEIGTELEVLASQTLAEKGIKLIGTTHGSCLTNLIKNPRLVELIGGIQYVTLSDDEAKKRKTKKSILERKSYPTFDLIIEINNQKSWTIHENVGPSIDLLLDNRLPAEQVRQNLLPEKIKINCQITSIDQNLKFMRNNLNTPILKLSFINELDVNPILTSNSLDITSKILTIYCYGLSINLIKEAATKLNLKFTITNNIKNATLILGLNSHLKSNLKLKQLAESKQIPIYSIKELSLYQLLKLLYRLEF